MTILGAKITKCRLRKRLSQQELSERIGVSQSVVSSWESDQCQPRSKYLDLLAQELEVRIEDLTKETFTNNEAPHPIAHYNVDASMLNELILTQKNLTAAIVEQNELLRGRFKIDEK
jgi:transcriptional regulator with XRE-family HTH domain